MDQLQPPIELCSKCRQPSNGCQCDQFHPNVVVPFNNMKHISNEQQGDRLSFPKSYKGQETKKLVIMDEVMAKQLLSFFMECGYISYEFYPKVHEFIDGHLRPYCEWLVSREK